MSMTGQRHPPNAANARRAFPDVIEGAVASLTQANLPEQSGQLSGVSLVYPITVEALGLMARDN